MDAIQVVRLALNVITERLLTIIALGMVFGLACYTMSNPDPLRLGTMAFFAVFSYLLLRNREVKYETESKTTTSQSANS
mgnify:CR=1 FL=1